MNKYIDQGKVLKLMRDIVFKNVMKDTNNREFLAKIISIATKIDYTYLLDNIVLTDTDTLESNIYSHHNTGDLVVIIENTKINIEASLDNK